MVRTFIAAGAALAFSFFAVSAAFAQAPQQAPAQRLGFVLGSPEFMYK
jgi:hypothetical protein